MARRSSKRSAAPDEVSVVIDAPADRLYDLVSDITKMGRLSPECRGGRWLGGATGPAVGARFLGFNRRGPVVWATINKVTAANRGAEFAWETPTSAARWGYRFQPADGSGTVVTETREIYRRRPVSARLFLPLLGGLESHENEMREGMRATLERLKVLAEAPEPVSLRGRARRKAKRAAKAAVAAVAA